MPPIPPELRASLLDRLVAGLSHLDGPLLPPDARRRRLGDWLDQGLAQQDDQLFGRRFARACPVPGMAPRDYQARLLHHPERATLLTGIRFKGGDVGLPFVDLLAWDRELPGPGAWAAVLDRVAADYAGFAPRWLRVRWPGQGAPPVPAERREIDQWLVAGRLGALRARPRPWGWESLDVRVATDLAFVDDFHAAFEAWRRHAGPRGREVMPAEVDELARCLETGAVVCAWQGQRWAGVAAAARAQDRALSGYEVVELFLDTPLRGQRRAPVLQRHLVEALADHGRDALYGTIHASNQPSLRTALRCGRQVVETWWFLQLPGAPTRR